MIKILTAAQHLNNLDKDCSQCTLCTNTRIVSCRHSLSIGFFKGPTSWWLRISIHCSRPQQQKTAFILWIC